MSDGEPGSADPGAGSSTGPKKEREMRRGLEAVLLAALLAVASPGCDDAPPSIVEERARAVLIVSHEL